MAKTRSTVQDLSVGVYDFDEGSGKTSHLVAFDTTNNDKVLLASADVNYSYDGTSIIGLTTVPAIGVIQRHYPNGKVQIRRQGQVSIKKETGITIKPGEIVFLSQIQSGRVTNVPPTQGVLQQIGVAENVAVGNTNVRVTFSHSHIVLLS